MQEKPGTYLVLDLGLAFAIGVLAYHWKGISDWLEARRLRAQKAAMATSNGSEPVDSDEQTDEPVASTQELRMQLHKAINIAEEVRWCTRTHTQTFPRTSLALH